MQKYAAYAFLLLLVACFNRPTVPQTPQEIINEANTTLTAAATVIGQNVRDGIFVKDEAQGYLDRVRELARRVDQAQDLVSSGAPDAGTQAELVRNLILSLHREVAAKARAKP